MIEVRTGSGGASDTEMEGVGQGIEVHLGKAIGQDRESEAQDENSGTITPTHGMCGCFLRWKWGAHALLQLLDSRIRQVYQIIYVVIKCK